MFLDGIEKLYSADIETDGFDSTKIHVTSITELDLVNMKPIRSFSLIDYDKIKEEMSKENIAWIFHNGHVFDKVQLEQVLEVPFKGKLIDTLGLSWYLYPKRVKHGLGSWGEDFGIPKPEVDDWEDQPIEVYINRCEEDVKIQTKMWQQMYRHLKLLYKDHNQLWDCIEYISGKMYALAVASKSKWKLDVDEAIKLKEFFDAEFDKASDSLEANMPQVPEYVKKTRPKKPYKKDGSLSAIGLKWLDIVKEYNKSFDYTGEIKVLKSYKDPNAGSSVQIKKWLFDLGWKPQTFKFVRNKETGEVKQIPQIKDPDTGELCESIKKLIPATPSLKYLENMGIVKHRSGVVNGFLTNVDKKGYIRAQAQGFTNTLRLKHKVAVNIPSGRKPYGKEIRGLLMARSEQYELLGSDMMSLEDRTKLHFMTPHDPKYVKEMSNSNYDAHTDMAVTAGLMTKGEEDFFKWYKSKH